MTAFLRQQPGLALPRVTLTDGTVEALKWLALVMMTIDHINKYLLDGAQPWMYALGRLAMPTFALVLAHNLARPGTLANGAYGRTLRRLAIAGAVATVPYVALGKGLALGWWPLNILFTLWVAAAVMHLLDSERRKRRAVLGVAALAVLLFGGALTEFWWPAIAMAVAAQTYFRAPSMLALVACAGSAAALAAINGNHWALAGLAMVLAAAQIELRVPRLRWVFYAYYPAHLALLWALQQGLRIGAAS